MVAQQAQNTSARSYCRSSVVFLLLAPCFDNRESRIKFIALVTVVATTVFLLVELPVFWELAQFRRAVLAELAHAAHGHDVRLPVISRDLWTIYLRESLLPGLGWPLLTLGMLGLTTPIWAPPERRQGLLVIAGFALVWYAIHELTPLKPFPAICPLHSSSCATADHSRRGLYSRAVGAIPFAGGGSVGCRDCCDCRLTGFPPVGADQRSQRGRSEIPQSLNRQSAARCHLSIGSTQFMGWQRNAGANVLRYLELPEHSVIVLVIKP